MVTTGKVGGPTRRSWGQDLGDVDALLSESPVPLAGGEGVSIQTQK